MTAPGEDISEMLDDLMGRIRNIGGGGGAVQLSEIPGRPGVFNRIGPKSGGGDGTSFVEDPARPGIMIPATTSGFAEDPARPGIVIYGG